MPTRNRSKGVALNEPNSYIWRTEQPFNYGAQASITYGASSFRSEDTDVETMTDVTGSAGSINSCTHVKKRIVTEPRTNVITYRDNRVGQTGFRECFMTDGCGSELDFWTTNHLTVPNGSALAIARVPTLSRSQANILVSLYELKDLKNAFERAIGHVSWARFRSASATKRGVRKEETSRQFLADLVKLPTTPMEFAKYYAGNNLAWKFGWKPFIDDVQKVHSILGKLSDKYQSLSNQEFSCVGRHEEKLSDVRFLSKKLKPASFPFVLLTKILRRETTVVWYAGVKRKLSPYALAHPNMTKLALAREQLGLNPKITQAWEIVPYSFVADWVLPIQQFIEQFDGSPLESDYVINGAQWATQKKHTVATITVKHEPVITTNYRVDEFMTSTTEQIFTGHASEYKRTAGPWTAPELYLPQLRLPNVGQSWTGMQLLLQRFRSIAR